MIRVVALLLSIVCCFEAAGGFAVNQGPNPPTEVDFRVHGVGLGSSDALVFRQLGRPVSRKREKIVDEYEVCGPNYTLLCLNYEGAVVELNGDLRGRDFKVVSMEVTAPKLLVAPGIKMGLTEAEIRSKLGDPWQIRNESGARILDYVTKSNDGVAALHLVDGRLVKVQWQYTRC